MSFLVLYIRPLLHCPWSQIIQYLPMKKNSPNCLLYFNQLKQVSHFHKIMTCWLVFSRSVCLFPRVSACKVIRVRQWLVCCSASLAGLLCVDEALDWLCCFYDAVFVWPALVGLLLSDGVCRYLATQLRFSQTQTQTYNALILSVSHFITLMLS